jgi:hypothetical protein
MKGCRLRDVVRMLFCLSHRTDLKGENFHFGITQNQDLPQDLKEFTIFDATLSCIKQTKQIELIPLQDKIKLIKDSQGKSHRHLAEVYKVGRTQVTRSHAS